MDPKRQFAAGAGAPAPSAWVDRFLAGVPAGAAVLDVACGRGRHLRLALARGFSVTGVDRDLSGVADLAGWSGIRLVEADLEGGAAPPFAGQVFDAVIVTNYLWRPILPAIVAAVAPAGLLIYETFGTGNARYGKPSNPAFLLRPGELIEAVHGQLTVVAYEHATVAAPQPRVVQRIAAVGPAHPWLLDPPSAPSCAAEGG